MSTTAITRFLGAPAHRTLREQPGRFRLLWERVKAGVRSLGRPNRQPSSLPSVIVEGVPPFMHGRIGDIRVMGQLGQGGMGTLLEAERVDTDMRLAVKTTSLEHAALLEAEAQALEMLAPHPNIVAFVARGQVEGWQYLVMERIQGDSLRNILKLFDRLPLPVAIEIARSVCCGLKAASEKGVVWADLKPPNIMITDEGKVKLIDPSGPGFKKLPPNMMGGSPSYMAPEQVMGQFGKRTDMYALGIVIYEMLAGRKPFEADSEGEIFRQQMEKPLNYDHRIPPAVRPVLDRLTAKDPNDRYPDYDAVEAELAKLAA